MNLGSVPHRHDDLDVTPRKALIRRYEQSGLGGIAGSIGVAGPRSGSRQHGERERVREMARSGTVSRGGSSNAADVFENSTAINFRRAA